MRESRRKISLGRLDILFLGISAAFLISSVFRVCGTEYIGRIRREAASFVLGELSAERVIRTIGSWEDPDELIAAVFHAKEEKKTAPVPEQPEVDFENAVLSGTLFPDTVDPMNYLIEFACKTPVVGEVTSGFGEREDPISGEKGFHYGIDVAAAEGEPIRAVASGIVQETGENSYGKYIVVAHEDGLQSLYAHCSAINAAEGQQVKAGEKIAAVGMTGRATGNHLHFELWRAGKILDPTEYLAL